MISHFKFVINMRKDVPWMLTKSAAARIQSIVLIGLFCMQMNSAISQQDDLPCDFLDSMNITDGVRQPNNSIIFENLEFAAGQYVNLNYTLKYGIEHVTVSPYIRGCICNRKPCIRLCCPYGSVQVNIDKCQPNDAAKKIGVFRHNYQHQQISDQEQENYFAFVDSYPCKQPIPSNDPYLITPQGQVQLIDRSIEHKDYCIAVNFDNSASNVTLRLLVCNESVRLPNDHSNRNSILPICMLLSVLFIIVTLIIFGCISKLQSLNGKCLICYLATLALGYTFLSGVQLSSNHFVQPLLCDSVGYLIYFTLFSAFLWLSVINFDLWLSFQFMSKFKQQSEQKQFFWYSVYSCGVPCLLTVIIVILDVIESIPEPLRPGVGTSKCFLHQAFLPQFLFFYLPVGIIIALNIFLFILTAINFYQARQQAKEMRQSQENISQFEKTFSTRIDDVLLYLQLFLIAGVAWVLEIISFLVYSNNIIFLFIDIWNGLQGILIFILLVMRRPVLQLIRERWRGSPTNTSENVEVSNYLRMSSLTDDAFNYNSE